MTMDQRTEFLKFLDEQNPNETLQSCAFRLLCFSYENRVRKPWIQFKQADNAPIQEAELIVFDKTFSFCQTIKEVKESIQGKRRY